MADTAMASRQPGAPAPGVGGVPSGGLAALKYAAQADVFQDDPNFYSWLEDWIGKQDEETVMIDAFHTLSDYGMQFDFQQQQQQQQQPHQASDVAASAPTSSWGLDFPTPQLDASTVTPPPPQHNANHDTATGHGPSQRPPNSNPSGGTSSCTSLASHPSSVPSEDNSSFVAMESTNGSTDAPSTLPQPMYPSLAAAAAAAGLGGASLPTTGRGGAPPASLPLPPSSAGSSGDAPGVGRWGPGAGAATPFFSSLPVASLPGKGQPAAQPGAGAFTAATFTQPLSRGLDAAGLPLELQAYLGRDRDTSSTGSSLQSKTSPMNNGGGGGGSGGGLFAASHGTVSSYVGAPSAAVQPQPAAAAGAAPPKPSPGASALYPPSGTGGGLLGSSAAVTVPSLEQLIVRAICGNGNDMTRNAGGAGGLWGLAGLRPPETKDSAGAAAVPGRPPPLGLGLGGTGFGACAGAGALGLGSGAAELLRFGPGGSNFGRNSSGSFGDEVMGGTEGIGAGSGSGTAATASRFGGGDNQDSPDLMLRSLLEVSSAGGLGSSATAAASGKASQRQRRKSCSSGLAHGSHSSGHGLPVSHAHGHGHVGKVAVAGWARGGGSAAGGGGGGGASGGAAGSRMTRSARAKAVFAALEAEVAGKMGELEALQRENASLTQRVEILEVAVERQNAVLSLMNAARAGAAGLAAIATTVPRQPVLLTGAASDSLSVSQEAAGMINVVAAALGDVPSADSLAAAADSAPERTASSVSMSGSSGILSGMMSGGSGAGPSGRSLGQLQLSPVEVLSAGPGSPAGTELLEWARRCTVDNYKAWYKDHLQSLSLALLAMEDTPNNPDAETHLHQLVAACWVRTTLTSVFQPLTILRLKGLNLETDVYAEPPEQHWMDVIKFMTVSPQQVADMENLFNSYNMLHESFRAELQDTQRDLAELVARQHSPEVASKKICTDEGLSFVLQQTALLKRVRSILQKTHLLYSCTIGVAAMRILKPKEFAKCCVQSYPYHPCGPSLMKACAQMRAMKAIWGVGGC